MFRKSIMALVLSVSMILSPLSGGGTSIVSAASAAALPTGNVDTLSGDGGETDNADSGNVSTPDGGAGGTVAPDAAEPGNDALTPDGAENGDNTLTPDGAGNGGEALTPDGAENGDNTLTPDAMTLSNGEEGISVAQADENGVTTYLSEDFEAHTIDGQKIIASGSKPNPAPDPVTKGSLTYKAGARSNGSMDCSASFVQEGGNKYLSIVQDGTASADRGIKIDFVYGSSLPAMADLKSGNLILELSMDITTPNTFGIVGFASRTEKDSYKIAHAAGVPEITGGGHLCAVIDPGAEKKYAFVTSSEGKILISMVENLTDDTTFTGLDFCSSRNGAGTTTIDNIKVVSKSADAGLFTVTVKDGTSALQDAKVVIDSVEQTTDAEGKAFFALPYGTYTVKVSKDGYQSAGGDAEASESITMSADSSSKEVTLKSMSYTKEPGTVTLGGGQIFVAAPKDNTPVQSEAFTVAVIDQNNIAMNSDEYDVVWKILPEGQTEADPAVTIDTTGKVSVSKDFNTDNKVAAFTVTATVTANEKSKDGTATVYVGNSDVLYYEPMAWSIAAATRNVDKIFDAPVTLPTQCKVTLNVTYTQYPETQSTIALLSGNATNVNDTKVTGVQYLKAGGELKAWTGWTGNVAMNQSGDVGAYSSSKDTDTIASNVAEGSNKQIIFIIDTENKTVVASCDGTETDAMSYSMDFTQLHGLQFGMYRNYGATTVNSILVEEYTAPEPAPTIEGKTSITMKSDGSVEETYTVKSTIADEEFAWTVAAKAADGNTTGISITDGKLTVAATAAAGTYVITATSKSDETRKAEIEVTIREATSEPVKEYLVIPATGNETAIDSSAIVPKEGAITGYQITTATADKKLIEQKIVEELPASVNTAGVAKVEVAPVYTYEGKADSSSFSFDLAEGNYDFIIYNKTNGERCDVFLNDESGSQMLLNNMFQYGNIPDHMRVHDIVHKGSTAAIEIKEFSSGHEYKADKIKVDAIKVPEIVDRVPKMYVLGDSLVAIYYNGGSKENTAPQTGWGQVLQEYLTDDIEVVDLANSGITAVGLESDAFSRIRVSAQSGDIFMLESGFNDADYDKHGDDKDGTNMKAAVTTMVTEAKAKGMDVILVSPNASAQFYGDPVKWSDKMEELATQHSVKFLDLSELSYNFLKGVYGENDATDNAVRLKVSEIYNIEVELKGLHSNYNAAQKWASLVAQELKDSLGYADLVKTDIIHWFDDKHGNVVTCSAVKGQEIDGIVTVTWDMQGHGVQIPTNKILENSILVEPTMSKVYGYTFEGWYTDAAFTTKWNFATDKVTANMTLYAKWTKKAGSEVPEEAVLYFEDFEGRTSTAEVGASSGSAPSKLTIVKDNFFGDVLSFDFIDDKEGHNTRNAVMKFGYTEEAAKKIAALKQYVVEFDAFVTPGNKDATNIAIMGADAVYATNGVMTSGYLFDLRNAGSSGIAYTINQNDDQKVTIPAGVWCHYKVYVDQEQGTGGMVSTTITRLDTDETLVDKALTSYSGKGVVDGFYICAGRYNAAIKVNDILVRNVLDTDEFGELQEETLLKVEFGSGLNQIIKQPALDSPVHKTIALNVIGDQGTDLSGKATITWSMGGMDEADGYVSLTKESGTGEGTTGVDPDGATAYFNVRNGVKNLFGYVKATVTYGDKTIEVMTPVAVLGDDTSPENRLAPKPGYPVSMDSLEGSLLGYKGTELGFRTGDLVLNNWALYGSNELRSFSLKEVGGKKALEFASNGGTGSTVAVYQWADQTKQYVMDLTVQFTAGMTFGVYADTPNNADRAKPEWEVSYASGALNLGTEGIPGINAREWYRIVVSADPSTQKVSMMVYDSKGVKLGEIEDMDMTNPTETHKYFCFQGTWPMYLNSFEAYRPILGTITINADSDTVKVPDAGQAAAELPLSATLLSTDGLKMTGAVTWSLPDENPGVEIVSDGKQGATLKVSPEASGTVRVVAAMDGKTAEKVIQLTTSSNVVSFKTSTGSITIPLDGEAAVARTFEAETLKGDGSPAEDGGAITYSLLGKDGMSELTSLPKGVTFENGVLTVAPGAAPAVLYVKAVNEQGLSNKVKVNIHGLSFAFGSADAAEGFTQVTNEMYNDTLGFGFLKTEGLTVNGDNVTGTEDFRFKVKVPNGNYTVKVDTTAASVTSEVVESVPAVTGITKTGSSFNVAVCDGILDLTFPAASSVKSVEISQMAPKAALAKPMVYAIGDSTTSNTDSPGKSWGNCVADGEVTVPAAFTGFENHGKAGDDSVVYYNAGRVEDILLAICPGDYVTVNMGINSRAANEPASYYTLLSEYYVEGILQRGGIPVIVTATPDGPVGDRLSTNYNAATGEFTNSRGDSVHIADLRDIAKKKDLHVIELGQWGQDWMNSLTMDDVNAYNAEYGTSFTTVLEMVQDWYKDHNHYKAYLAIKIGDYILGEVAKLTGYVPEEPEPGEVVVKPVPEEGAPETELNTSPEEIKENLKESGYLDNDTMQQIEEGAKCEVSMSIKDADTAGTVTTEEKQKVEDVVSTLGSSSEDQYGAPKYIDISLSMKLVKDGAEVPNSKKPLTELKQGLVITITIPEELINTDPSKKREYIIIRVHNGVAEQLAADYNETEKKLTFSSELFSTYALVTKDTAIGSVPTPTPGVPTPTPGVPTPTPGVPTPTPGVPTPTPGVPTPTPSVPTPTPDVPTPTPVVPTPTPVVPTPTPGVSTPTPAPGDTGSNDSDDSDDVQQTGENVTTGQAPKTGDTMDATFMSWFMILAAALAGAGAVVIGKRRREE